MEKRVSIRFGPEGKETVTRALDDIATSGDATAKRWARSFENAERDVTAAMQRSARAADKIAAIMPQSAMQMRIGDANGTGYGQWEGSARQSAAAFKELLDVQDKLDKKTKLVTGSTGNMRSAMAGASYQVQDFATQVSMGANPINAFVVQAGQLAGQFQNVEGKAGAVARFLMGGWGLALQVGLFALAPLVAKLFEGGKAADEAKKATEAHKKAILDLAAAQEKALLTAERKQALDVAGIRIELDAALATRARTQAALEGALAQEQVDRQRAQAPGQRGENASLSAAVSSSRAAGLEQLLAANAKATTELQRGFDLGISRLLAMRIDARSTPEGAVTARYQDARSAAMQELAGQANGPALAARLRELNAERDRELKAIQASTQARTRDAETLSASQVAKFLRSDLPGVSIGSTTRTAAENKRVDGAKNSYHLRGQAVDFVPAGGMSSMSKADVRALFEKRGIEIVELLGPGDKGHSDHFHVAWTKGKMALDEFTDAAKRAKVEGEKALALSKFIGGVGDANAGLFDGLQAQRDQEGAEFNRNAVAVLGITGDPLGTMIADGDRANKDAYLERRKIINDEKQAWLDLKQVGSTTLDRLFDPNSAQSWGDRVKGILGDLKAEFIKLALLNPLKNALFGDGLPTLASSFGKLFGGANFGSPDLSGTLNSVDGLLGVGRNATGTEFWSGGMSLVGENGPELVSMPRGSRVNTASDTRRLIASGNDSGRGGPTVIINADRAVLADEVRSWVAQGVEIAAARGAAGGAQIGEAERMGAGTRRLGRSW